MTPLMAPVYRPGSWCDVAVWIDGRLLQVAVEGARVRCFLEDVEVWEQRAPEPLLFCRAAVHQQLVFSIHQGQSGACWLVGNGLVQNLGPTFGVQPVAIDSHYAYVVRSAFIYDEIDLETGETHSFASPAPGSSQGISDVNPIDGLWWADLHRSMEIGGATFTYPNTRGWVTVGQVDPAGISAAINGRVSPVLLGDGFEPHLAPSGSRVAVCARTQHGAAYSVLSIPLDRVAGPVNR